MQRKPSAEVEACKARLNVCSHRFEKRDEPCRIDSACTVHPVDGLPSTQRIRHPMLGNTSHAFPRTSGSAEMVELASLRLYLGGINALCASNKCERLPCDRVEILRHVNH